MLHDSIVIKLLMYLILILSKPPEALGTTLMAATITVPTHYTALQGQLVVHVQFSWIFDNEIETEISEDDLEYADRLLLNKTGLPPAANELATADRGFTQYSSEESKWNSIPNGFIRRSPSPTHRTLEDDSEQLFLSLYVSHSNQLLERYKVPGDLSQNGFVFPCGVVVHGGQHVVRLKRNEVLIAESSEFNVSWPKVVIDVPSRLETYRSPADITFRFIQSNCLPINPRFKTWAELLYHGPDAQGSVPTRPPTAVLRDVQKLTPNPDRTKREATRLRSGFDTGSDGSNEGRGYSSSLVGKIADVHNNKEFSEYKSHLSEPEVKVGFEKRSKVSLPTARGRNVSTIRPKRMFTLTSLEGSTIRSKSNSNIRPEALKLWSWESGASGAQVAQRVPVEGSLYSRPVHEIRFSCEVVGPAGVYSVRVVSDVFTNPVIASSATFMVDWAEEFTLYIPRPSLIPCLSPLPVMYTQPLCVGSQDKIRLYAHVRANVTSTNPPMYLRYITENRASNRSSSFDCSLFTDGPPEYCFVYVNRASSGAVSDVRRKCVATFKPDVLRIDGEWSKWSSWSECTASCGEGINIRYRFCDSPPPRNGGLFCKGPSISTRTCGDPGCVPPVQTPIPSSVIPPSGESEECECGCHVALERESTLVIAASAQECSDTVSWVVEGPVGTVVASKLLRAALLPGFQWLKIRDGNSSSAPLLLALPSSGNLSPGTLGRESRVPLRLTSTTPVLFISFRSDINSSFMAPVWGFKMSIQSINPPSSKFVLAVLASQSQKRIMTIHIVIIVLAVTILASVSAYGAYYCRQYSLIKKTLLVVEDSPLETPEGSPFHQIRKPTITSASSVSTLTEVLSLKSLKFSCRKDPSRSTSYTRLATSYEFKNGVLRSLPTSPLVSSKRFSALRRSSATQLNRVLRRGNGYQKQKNRRSASFDQLRPSLISPILEDKPLSNSYTLEDVSLKESKVYIELEPKAERPSDKNGEDHSAKYKEYRKSLLLSKHLAKSVSREGFEALKMNKERANREKASMEKIRRTEGGVKSSSSVSELSVSGYQSEVDLEYDYYDYDVGNASAAPGSLFGMDPTLMPWMIDIDELDIKSPDQLTSPNRNKITDEELRRFSLVTPSPPNARKKLEEIPLQKLNILPTPDLLQNSSTSNESNENNDEDEDRTPTAESMTFSNGLSEKSEFEEKSAKILNIHDVEDFQFADESEDEE